MFLSDGQLESFLRCPSQLRVLTDQDLIAALRCGCNDALAVLFERHSAMLSGIARDRVHDCDAEAIVCEFFEDFFRTKTGFDSSQECFQQWLMKYAKANSGRTLA
jgi:RNA polymerase sigma-70 factor, ECF subfamily